MHWTNLTLSLFMWGCAIAAIIFAIVNDGGLGFGDGDNQTVAILLIVFGTLYLGYLIEICLSSTQKYLCNIEEKDGVHRLMDRLQRTAPQIIWRIQCYHMETRTRWTTYTDANGNSHS